ncbi:MAG: transglycosylase SLT domain-containing protein [Bacteroidaceae bacterium]|nr:transglycosylase SLT domain-containing protein [Bacteroidaceae bacterium]
MRKQTTYIITLLLLLATGIEAQENNFTPGDSISDNAQLDRAIASPDTLEIEGESIGCDSLIFELPEGMTANIDSLMSGWQARHLLKSLDCQTEGWEFIKTSDTAYAERLRDIPSIIDMPYNSMVRQCIDRYATRNRSLVSYMLGIAEFYMPMIEAEIDKHNMPHELKYLPVIESALNPKAVSRAGAKGLWQFMFATGKLYGLKSNNYIDDRFDPLKATHAGLNYLRDLYKFFNRWDLAIAAYNCGPGNVKKAILRSGGKTDFWEIYRYLPRETRGYLPALIAANYIMTYHEEHGICPMEPALPIGTDTLHIRKNLHFKQIEKYCDINIEDIRALNPQYIKDIVPGEAERYVVRLTNDAISRFITYEDSIYNYNKEEFFPNSNIAKMLKEAKANDDGRGTLKYHKIRNGETLGSIARKYRVTVKQIMKWNNMRNTKIRAGKRLKIYK